MNQFKPQYCSLTDEQKEYVRGNAKHSAVSTMAITLKVPPSIISSFMVKEKLSFNVSKKYKYERKPKKPRFDPIGIESSGLGGSASFSWM